MTKETEIIIEFSQAELQELVKYIVRQCLQQIRCHNEKEA